MSIEEVHKYVEGIIGVIEANSFEQMCLYKEYVEDHKKPWVASLSGLTHCVGYIGKRPVNISMFTAVVDSQKVLFYDNISQVVDHKMIREWFEKTMPASAYHQQGPARLNSTNAMNFHNVFRR